MFSTCPFVRPSVRLSVTNLWTLYFENEWTNFNANWHNLLPEQRHERLTSGLRRSKVKVTRGRSSIWKPGGDIILDPLSRVNRGMQWATEMFNVAIEKGARGEGVAHSCNCPPPRLPDMRLANALVSPFTTLLQDHVCQSVRLSHARILSKRQNI